MSSPAAVHPGLGAGLSATTLDFGALNPSPCSLFLSFIFYPSFVRLHLFIPSVSGHTVRQSGGGGTEGSDKRGQSRHHSRLHPSDRCVSPNDLMNTSPADQPLTAHHTRRPVSLHAHPLCVVCANLLLHWLAGCSDCHILMEVISDQENANESNKMKSWQDMCDKTEKLRRQRRRRSCEGGLES